MRQSPHLALVPLTPLGLLVQFPTMAEADIFNLWAMSMRAEGARPNTIEIRLTAVRGAAQSAGRPAAEMSTYEVRAWLGGHPNPNTKSTYYRAARVFFGWLVAEGTRADDPMAGIKSPPVPRGVPRPCRTGDLARMLTRTEGPVRAMLLLGAFQGLRAGEVAAVHGEDFDLDAAEMRVVGKGGVEAVLPLHSEVAAVAGRMPTGGYWFPARLAGGHIRSERVSQLVRAACEASGVPAHGAHPLRHWFATSLVRSGTDLRTTQSLMRHASLATTARYVEITDEARRAAVLRLPVLGDIAP